MNRSTLSILAMAAIVLALQAALAEEVLVLVPLDSCGFEVSREVSERRLVDGIVVYPAMLGSLDLRKARLVILAARPPEEGNLKSLMKFLEESGAAVYASSDVLALSSLKTISSRDLAAWCELRDEEALLRVAESLKTGSFSAAPLLALGALAVALATLGGGVTSAINKAVEKAQEAPAILAVLAFRLRRRGRLEEREVFEHPIRASIIEALRESPMSFSQLQRRLGASRAVLEWHLGVLKSYGVVLEERDGRSRIYRLSEDFKRSSF